MTGSCCSTGLSAGQNRVPGADVQVLDDANSTSSVSLLLLLDDNMMTMMELEWMKQNVCGRICMVVLHVKEEALILLCGWVVGLPSPCQV
jgi:hypothetical protein